MFLESVSQIDRASKELKAIVSHQKPKVEKGLS
jgi:hypothetical protein